MSEPRFLSIRCVAQWVPMASARKVSEVARSPRGFLAAFSAAGGDPRKLSDAWRRKRINFIARHTAQMRRRREPLYEKGTRIPTRRHLALIMWAYSPVDVC